MFVMLISSHFIVLLTFYPTFFGQLLWLLFQISLVLFFLVIYSFIFDLFESLFLRLFLKDNIFLDFVFIFKYKQRVFAFYLWVNFIYIYCNCYFSRHYFSYYISYFQFTTLSCCFLLAQKIIVFCSSVASLKMLSHVYVFLINS